MLILFIGLINMSQELAVINFNRRLRCFVNFNKQDRKMISYALLWLTFLVSQLQLIFNQHIINTSFCSQVGMRTYFSYTTFFHDYNLVCIFHGT